MRGLLPVLKGQVSATSPKVKLIIFICMSAFNYAGWALADSLGFEIFGCFVISGLISMIGVWLGWKIGTRLGY